MHLSRDIPAWFTHERRNWCALVFVAALLGYSAGNGHTTQGAIQEISDKYGTVKQHDACATSAAKVATTLVVASQEGTYIDPATIPTCPQQHQKR